jgi:cell division protein FtsQ
MKILIRILILIPAIYLVGMPVWLSFRTSSALCSGISIDLADSSDYHFISKGEISSLVSSNGTRVLGVPLRKLPVPEIEERISRIKQLKDVEVYTTIDGMLHVYLDQRDPVMRVIAGGGDYFVDRDGVVFPKRGLYTPRLHIVGGNIRITQPMLDGISVFDTSIKRTSLRDAYQLVQFISGDRFWSAQVDQIYIDEDDEIDIIPRMGRHLIHLGSIDNYEGKLRNLKAFYDQVLPETGWSRYYLINLEFRDQIVCKKRE